MSSKVLVEARTYWIYPEKVFVTYWIGDESYNKVFDSQAEFSAWVSSSFGPPVRETNNHDTLD